MSSMSPRVSVGLPVYNGQEYLGQAIESILSQQFEDLELVISDNASTDATPDICREWVRRDPRVRYLCNPENLGAARNYRIVFAESRGEYFKWAAHDDLLAPEYVERCVGVLDAQPSVVLCHSVTRNIDESGGFLQDWSAPPLVRSPDARRRFSTILHLKEVFLVWGLGRRAAFAKTPLLGSYAGHDRPFLSSLALQGTFFEIEEPLFSHRQHPTRSVHAYSWRKPRAAMGWYDTSRKGDRTYPNWRLLKEHALGVARAPAPVLDRAGCLVELARWAHDNRAGLARDLVLADDQPGLRRWLARLVDSQLRDIERVLPPEDPVILVDDEHLDGDIFGRRPLIPFLEKDGQWWGAPEDSDSAIRECERLRRNGARFIVFARPAFWWLDHYVDFVAYLRSGFPCLVDNSRFVIFDLSRSGTRPG